MPRMLAAFIAGTVLTAPFAFAQGEFDFGGEEFGGHDDHDHGMPGRPHA